MSPKSDLPPTEVDAVVIGAGFSGLYALHRLKEMGLSAQGFEAGSNVGGTWYWNRYPGARTDSTFEVYQYFFSDELLNDWNWSERFPAQEETERYLNFAADRLKLRPMIRFNTRVVSAQWSGDAQRWTVTTEQGDTVNCRYLLSCVGLLSEPKLPDIDGIDQFKGELLHTARWPRDGIELKGKRVGVIGTGATGIQVIQTVAKEAGELFVFQRSASYAVPMKNPKLTDEDRAEMRRQFPKYREIAKTSLTGHHYDCQTTPWADTTPEQRRELFEQVWDDGSLKLFCGNYLEFLVDESANQEVTDFVKEKMKSRISKPELIDKLIPSDHGFGTRRPPLDTGYIEAFHQDNVHLIDVRSAPIQKVTETGVKTADGEFALDALICATGFDAGTGALGRIDVRGRNGVSLKAQWDQDITSAIGMQKHGFPNFFMSASPLSPSAAFCNVPTCIQQQIEWITDCIAHVEKSSGNKVIEATQAFEDQWVAHHDEVTQPTLIYKVDSWWTGANMEGKPRRVLSYVGVGAYREQCDQVAKSGYQGFEIR